MVRMLKIQPPGRFIWCLLMLIPFSEPLSVADLVATNSGAIYFLLSRVFSVWRITVIIGIFMLMLIERKQISFISLAGISFYLYIFLVCLVRKGAYRDAFSDLINVIGIALILEYWLAKNIRTLIKTFIFLEGLLIFINLITIAAYPDGMYKNFWGWEINWFLGYRNVHVYLYLPWIILVSIMSYSKHGRITWSLIAVTVLLTASFFTVDSSTSKIVFIVYLVLLIAVLEIKKIPVPNATFIVLASIALSYSIIFLKIQDYFADFIQNSLNRDVTFTGRVAIWSLALQDFYKHPIFGAGSFTYLGTGWNSAQAHNAILNLLVIGGIVGLLIFVGNIVLSADKVKKLKTHPYVKILLIGLAAYCVGFLAEMYKMPQFFFMILFFIYHANELIIQLPVQPRKRTVKIKFPKIHVLESPKEL